jgi:DNA-binding transcriptional ArsR family regulator
MNLMPSSKADLLLHPIRLRIVMALSNREMSAKELSEAVPDVPLTTLYRQINALVEGGLLQVVGETQIRGTVERTYARAIMPTIKSEDLHGMTRQDYEQAFIIYLSTLMSAARRYLDSKGEEEVFDPLADGVDLSLGTLELSEEEFRTMNQRILEILLPAINNQPAPGRKQRLFTYLFIPQ